MISPVHILTWTLSVLSLPVSASWFSRVTSRPLRGLRRLHNLEARGAQVQSGGTFHNAAALKPNYTYSLTAVQVIKPSVTSQGMLITSIIPIYEVCNGGYVDASTSMSPCSTVFTTVTTASCSTVLSAWFTKVTVTECTQEITFSTKNSYSLATTTVPVSSASTTDTSLASSTPTTYVQNIVSYYIAPWQSLIANTPSGITVQVCKTDIYGVETCEAIQEIWVVHTEKMVVTKTQTISISTTFPSPVILLLGPLSSHTLNLLASAFILSTTITHRSMSFTPKTTVSTIEPTFTSTSTSLTSTLTSTTTVRVTPPPITITRTVELVSTPSSDEPTTTFFSTTQITSTITVHPIPQSSP